MIFEGLEVTSKIRRAIKKLPWLYNTAVWQFGSFADLCPEAVCVAETAEHLSEVVGVDGARGAREVLPAVSGGPKQDTLAHDRDSFTSLVFGQSVGRA